jgi:hypothetical protein
MRNDSVIAQFCARRRVLLAFVSIERFRCNRKQMLKIDSRENYGRRLLVFSVC